MRFLFFLFLAATAVASLQPAEAPAPGSESEQEEISSAAIVFTSGGKEYEAILLSVPTPEETPVVVLVANPFEESEEAEYDLAVKLVEDGLAVLIVDLGGFKDEEALLDQLEDDPESLFDIITSAIAAIQESTDVFASSVAVVGHGVSGTVVLEAARFGSLDVLGVAVVSPTSLRVSADQDFDFSGSVGLYVTIGGGVSSGDVFEFEDEMRETNSTYEVTTFSSTESSTLKDELTWQRTQNLLRGFMRTTFFPAELEYLEDPFVETNVANGGIEFEFVDYEEGEDALRGFIAYPSSASTGGPLPLVVIAPDWDGVDDYEIWRAKLIASMGYVGFAADMYGSDIKQGPELPIDDRRELTGRYSGPPFVGRLAAAVAAAAAYDLVEVDSSRIAMMGYCFGGSGVLELARSDLDGLKGVIAFHPGTLVPRTVSNAECQEVALLIQAGADDGSIPADEIEGFFEFNSGDEATFEFTHYGKTVHGFTVPTNPRDGVGNAYSPYADVRSFSALENFLTKIFSENSLYDKC